MLSTQPDPLPLTHMHNIVKVKQRQVILVKSKKFKWLNKYILFFLSAVDQGLTFQSILLEP